MDFRTLIRAALIAGVVAGLATGLLGLAITERYVDRAIALEAARTTAESGGMEGHEDVFSRRTQKAGLIFGDLLFGVAISSLFAGVFGLVAGARARADWPRVALGLAAGAVVAVVLVPFLLYPPFPPGVGSPDTLARRQALFIACVLLTIVAVWIGVRIHGRLQARGQGVAVGAGVAVVTVAIAALALLLPGRSDAILIPDRLLWQFRLASLAGQLLFWALFAALFARLVGLRPTARPRTALPDLV